MFTQNNVITLYTDNNSVEIGSKVETDKLKLTETVIYEISYDYRSFSLSHCQITQGRMS